MKKYFLTFHTIFIMDENVEWIEEFLIYYLNLGFEHFYLYDNTGSIGFRSNRHTTRYGFPIVKQDPKIWRDIYSKYKQYITYIKYNPKNEQGDIIYNQVQGITDFVNEYKHEADWCFVGDFDEFIFSPKNNNLLDLIKSVIKPVITFHQKMFLHRDRTTKRFITQEYQCINNLSSKLYGGQKSIINLESFKGLTSCHNFKGKKQVLSLDEWRFNHYIFCEHGKRSTNKQKWKYELTVDDSMKKYKNLFNET